MTAKKEKFVVDLAADLDMAYMDAQCIVTRFINNLREIPAFKPFARDYIPILLDTLNKNSRGAWVRISGDTLLAAIACKKDAEPRRLMLEAFTEILAPENRPIPLPN